MAKDPFRSPTVVTPNLKYDFIAGGAAGALTLTGIQLGFDRLHKVVQLDLVEAAPPTWAFADLTSEFSITADDTIDNTGGTNTTGDGLFIVWEDHDYGERTDVPWQTDG
jgi:hypothetical protein